MAIYAYIYTRCRKVDYNFVARPASTEIPLSVADDFKKKIVELLDISDRKELEIPQYVLVKNSGITLWGIAALNITLNVSTEHQTDDFGRLVRCFIGIVSTDADANVSLPLGVEFFSKMYEDIVSPIWNNNRIQSCNVEIELPTKGEQLKGNPCLDVNTNKDVLRAFYGNNQVLRVLASCLSCRGDISVATNVTRIRRVSMPKSNPFTNVVLMQEKEIAYEDIPVKYVCPSCRREVPYSEICDGYCSECKPYDKGNENFEEPDVLEVPMYECKKCHNKFEQFTDKGYCEVCARKRQYQKYVLMAVIFLLILILIKNCTSISLTLPNIKVPSLF